jgi:hypothetical protein
MGTVFSCWQCGEPLSDMILPVSRRESCRCCSAEIHCCRMCIHFRPNRLEACGEERAEDVSNRELANFCDYFAPSQNAFHEAKPGDDQARNALEALFGHDEPAPAEPQDARKALDDLFGKPDG